MTRSMGTLAVIAILCLMACLAAAQGYHTNWRMYQQPLTVNVQVPFKFEEQAGTFAIAYKGFGLGTCVMDVHMWDMFDDFENQHKFIANILPVYFYFLPYAANRKAFEVTPIVLNMHAGFCGWGPKGASLFDVGFGFQWFILQVGVGYKSIKSESRNSFTDPGELDNDYAVNDSKFYAAITLTPGTWISLGAKAVQPTADKTPPGGTE